MKRKEKEQYVFGMIFLFANQLQAIADRNGGEITLKQWFLLMVIHKMENKAPTINLIADFMGYTRQNARKMLITLEKKCFVEIKKSTTDNRAQNVILTQKSMDYFEFSEKFGNELLDEVFYGLNRNQITSLYKVFEIVSNNINKMNHVRDKENTKTLKLK